MHKIILLMLLTTIAGCGEKASESKSENDAPPTQSTSLNGQFGSGPQTSEEKLAEMKRKAESGDARSQFGFARMYYNGDGVTKDDSKAAEWYEKAAVQGNAFAQYKLGEMYFRGEGVAKDVDKAVEWWQKAAAQDNDAAKESLKSLQAK